MVRKGKYLSIPWIRIWFFLPVAVQSINVKAPKMFVKNLSECCFILSLVTNFVKSKLYNAPTGFFEVRNSKTRDTHWGYWWIVEDSFVFKLPFFTFGFIHYVLQNIHYVLLNIKETIELNWISYTFQNT